MPHGRARTSHARSGKRASRLKECRARVGRIRSIKRCIGRRASWIFASGAKAAAVYGARVNGLADGELLALRRAAAAGRSPSAPGRSLSALLLLCGDPLAEAAVAPFLMWAKHVWMAITDRGTARLSLPKLRALWTAASPNSCTRWKDAKGPLQAAALSLRRLGWRWGQGGMRVTDDRGVQYNLVVTSPAFLKRRCREANHRGWERAEAARWLKTARLGIPGYARTWSTPTWPSRSTQQPPRQHWPLLPVGPSGRLTRPSDVALTSTPSAPGVG